ncbi:MAG: helix-turn-helix domain-containing protein [Verrucomicrobia bacterium]|nr:helix-turn-helix domain-containing protein [Verrucomicrobiota bacterium]
MDEQSVDIERILLALLAADSERRQAAFRVLQNEPMTEPVSAQKGPLLMRMGEAAQYVGLSRTTLWRLIKEGRLDTVELRRGSTRLRKADLDRLCASRMSRGHPTD